MKKVLLLIFVVTLSTFPLFAGGQEFQFYFSGGIDYSFKYGSEIVDVDNPTKPIEVSAVDTPGKVRDVFVTGDVAYAADEDAGLTILDVSNPGNPQELSTIDTPGNASGVYISDAIAYVADGNSLRIIDVGDAAAPVEIGNLGMSAGAVFVVGEFAYVAGCGQGFYVVWVKDPTAPKKVGFFDTPDSADNVFVSGPLKNNGIADLQEEGAIVLEQVDVLVAIIIVGIAQVEYGLRIYFI